MNGAGEAARLDQSGAERLRGRLKALGFDAVRFARAEPLFGPGLRAWLDAGNQADMAWIERGAEKRGDPDKVLPGARTLVMLGVNYATEGREARDEGGDLRPEASEAEPERRAQRSRPTWARYAQYSDYHDTIKAGLEAAGKVLEEVGGIGPEDHRFYVDTGPVLERGWAARAGIGFTGKNAMLISREFGNWLFLACIVTRLEVPADGPLPGKTKEGTHAGLLCGKCTRCLDACPTQAFAAPGVVDARRCVSYQTIENKGIIPRELRAGIGNRIYGCDVCAEVCPWNRFAQASRSVLLSPRPEIARLTLPEVLALTPERFAEIFRKTAIKRAKLAGLLRNACIVAGNTGARECAARIAELADAAGAGLAGAPAAPMVRAHAVWALARVGERERLVALRTRETDAAVLAEYAAEGL
jgi:epoxyqueuosine reductase